MEKIQTYWLDFFQNERDDDNWWNRKKALWEERDAEIVRIEGKGRALSKTKCGK